MTENAIAADLIKVEWSADGTGHVVIPGCKTVAIPEETTEYRDRTSLESPGRNKEYGVGLTDTGELSLSCFYTKELYSQAAAYKATGKPVHFKVTLPAGEGQSAGDTFEYTAYVNPTVPATDYDGDLMTDLKLRPTGLVTWTQGAATV